jgi:2-polyprenyl-3-methyl-5-hydroxy-6-metoxy-1,4-benzoquinol methylase
MNQPTNPGSEPSSAPTEGGKRQTLATNVSINTQHKKWERRAGTWDKHNDTGMEKVAATAIDLAEVGPGMDCLDLGCGGGRLALVLARAGASVLGVDVSEAMVGRMEEQARSEGLDSVRGVVTPIERLTLEPASLDVVVTNYALHHLLDDQKKKLVESAFEWLRPGGRLVVADLMLGRGATPRDRQIIAGKLKIMAKKGLPGYWRIAKNATRFMLRVHERPITPDAWTRLFESAGFAEVGTTIVVQEAAVVRGVKPLP